MVHELELPSFSIAKTDLFDDTPWNFVQNQIKKHLADFLMRVTICKGLVRVPSTEERLNLIRENHVTAIAGHKGVNKTYNRLRPHYY